VGWESQRAGVGCAVGAFATCWKPTVFVNALWDFLSQPLLRQGRKGLIRADGRLGVELLGVVAS